MTTRFLSPYSKSGVASTSGSGEKSIFSLNMDTAFQGVLLNHTSLLVKGYLALLTSPNEYPDVVEMRAGVYRRNGNPLIMAVSSVIFAPLGTIVSPKIQITANTYIEIAAQYNGGDTARWWAMMEFYGQQYE